MVSSSGTAGWVGGCRSLWWVWVFVRANGTRQLWNSSDEERCSALALELSPTRVTGKCGRLEHITLCGGRMVGLYCALMPLLWLPLL